MHPQLQCRISWYNKGHISNDGTGRKNTHLWAYVTNDRCCPSDFLLVLYSIVIVIVIYEICWFRDKLTAFEVPLLQVHYHAIRSFLYIEELLSLSHTLMRLKYSTRILAELSHKLDRLLFCHSLQASSSALEMAQFALLLLPSTPFSPSPFYLALFGVPFWKCRNLQMS